MIYSYGHRCTFKNDSLVIIHSYFVTFCQFSCSSDWIYRVMFCLEFPEITPELSK